MPGQAGKWGFLVGQGKQRVPGDIARHESEQFDTRNSIPRAVILSYPAVDRSAVGGGCSALPPAQQLRVQRHLGAALHTPHHPTLNPQQPDPQLASRIPVARCLKVHTPTNNTTALVSVHIHPRTHACPHTAPHLTSSQRHHPGRHFLPLPRPTSATTTAQPLLPPPAAPPAAPSRLLPPPPASSRTGRRYLEHVVVATPERRRLVFPCHAWFGEADCGGMRGPLERNLLPVSPEDSKERGEPVSGGRGAGKDGGGSGRWVVGDGIGRRGLGGGEWDLVMRAGKVRAQIRVRRGRESGHGQRVVAV